MKILLTQNTTYVPTLGGASKGNRLLVESLAARGHSCTVVAPATGVQVSLASRRDFRAALASRGIDTRPDATETGVDVFSHLGVEVHAVWDNALLYRHLATKIRESRPDWILVSSEDTGQLLLEAASEASPSRIVYIARTTWNLPFGPASAMPSTAKSRLLRQAAGVVVISDYLGDYLRRWGDLESVLIRLPVITLGAGPFPRHTGGSDGFVTMINPCAVKGIEIFADLARRFPEARFAAVPTWGTTADDRRLLERLANVTLLEPVDDIDEILVRTQTLLMPSLWAEAYGRSAVEAMLRGIPVLASDVGGLPEAKLGVDYLLPVRPISEYRNATDDRNLAVPVVPEQVLGPWEQALRRLLTDPVHHRQLSAASRRAALELIERHDFSRFEEYLEQLRPRQATPRKQQPESSPSSAGGDGQQASGRLSAGKKTLLALRALRRKRGRRKDGERSQTTRQVPSIRRQPRDRLLPLSFAQQRIWFFEQWEPGSSAFNIPMAVRLRGRLDRSVLDRTLAEILRRHEVLRSRLTEADDQPVQTVADPAPKPCPLIDLRALEPGRCETEAKRLAANEARRPFDLAGGVLARTILLRLKPGEHLFLLTLHHIAADGWSLGILLREIRELYTAFAGGVSAPASGHGLPALPIQYADFAAWQREWFQGERLERQVEYWQQQLAGAPQVLELPIDRPRGAIESYRGNRRYVRLGKAATRALHQLGRDAEATPFMILLAVLNVLLSRLCGQTDVVIGMVIANRNRPEIQNLIGYFSNTLPVRARLSGNPAFAELLRQIRTTCLSAYSHQDLPFEKLVEELNPERQLSQHPVFQVLFALQNAPIRRLELPDLELSPVEIDRGTAHLDLYFSLAEHDGRLRGFIEYNTDLFDASTVDRMASHFRILLEDVVQNPEVAVRELPLLGAAVRQQLLVEWNDPREGRRRDTETLHGLFERQVERSPDAVALVAENRLLSYRELDRRASRLACLLRRSGVGPEVRVALCMERSLELIIGCLGVLKAGGAYVPIDPAYPSARRDAILQDARSPNGRALLILTQARLAESFADSSAHIVSLDAETALCQPLTSDLPAADVAPEALAYVIYTSGTTGRPKGTGVPHRAVTRFVRAATRTYGITSQDRALQFCSISFDTSIEEIYPCLTIGATLLLRTEAMIEPSILVQRCAAWSVSFASVPTAFWHELVAQFAVDLRLPRCLRALVIGGERALPERLAAWNRQPEPRPRLINTYGLTETTVVSTAAAAAVAGSGEVTIGRPIDNAQVRVLESGGRPVPIGVFGELCIGGTGVGRGYLGQPRRTAERFIPNAWQAGGRLYRTGDLVRQLPDGQLDFRGRWDQQVKIRGFRVELGEIETVLNDHPAVHEAVVEAPLEPSGDARLVAYVVADPPPEIAELRSYLSARLPVYMVPASFLSLEAIPRTATGKIDRQALPAPERDAVIADRVQDAPRTPIEEILAEMWSDVLGVERIGTGATFFELGGHSLLATQLMSRLRAAFDVELQVRELFETPTIATLAERIESELQDGPERESAPALGPRSRDASCPLSFAQERLWFLDQLEAENPAYNLPSAARLEGELDVAVLSHTFRQIVCRHESLRTTFADRGGQPVQNVHRAIEFSIPLIDLDALEEEDLRLETERLARWEARRIFDLGRGPLFRITLLYTRPREHTVLFTMHHIISDGWSMGIFMQEVASLYDALRRGVPAPLPELPIQYPDYSLWQRELLVDDRLERQLDYWKTRLADAPPALELPGRQTRTAMRGDRGATRWLSLSAGTTQQLHALGQRHGVTLFMTLLAAFKALLFRYSGSRDLLVGIPIANRGWSEIEGLIGFFVNTLVVRTDLCGRPNFAELLKRVREATLGAYAHQDLPFEKLVAELNPERDLARSPLFQVMLALQNAPLERIDVPGLILTPLKVESETTRFEMFLELTEKQGQLNGALHYSTDLFEDQMICRLLQHLRGVLEEVAEKPETEIAALCLLTRSERFQLLWEWNDSRFLYPRDRSFPELFAEQVARTPHALAVSYGEQAWSYSGLDRRANRLAHHLIAAGVGPDLTVALLAARSPEFLTAVLAIFKAGGAYLPLDPNHPAERSRRVLVSSGSRLVLATDALESLLADVLADSGEERPETVSLDRLLAAEGPVEPPPLRCAPNQLAYVIFTSGSTGVPKGAMLEQQGMINHLVAKISDLDLSDCDVLAQTASQCFDISVWQFLVPLLIGGRLTIVPDEIAHDAWALLEHCDRDGISVLETVPSLMRAMLEALEAPEVRGARARPSFARLRWLIPTGEALPPELCTRWQRRYPWVEMINAYGPTECSDDVSHHRLVRPVAEEEISIPIGRPVINTELYVVDRQFRPVPMGASGELCVGGDGVGRGYLRQPQRTAAIFVPDPFPAGRIGARLYRTGDLARFLTSGHLDFLGRIDHQVKLRGFRIELGEIETVLRRSPRLSDAVVMLREAAAGPRLVAYVAHGDEPAPGGTELRTELQQTLPEHMVPSVFVPLSELPLTPNGKVDRKALPEVDAQGLEPAADYVAPRDEVEEAVAEIFAQVIGIDRVGIYDHFFTLGGHSLLATQVVARLRETFEIELALRTLFESPTVAELAGVIEESIIGQLEELSEDEVDDLLAV